MISRTLTDEPSHTHYFHNLCIFSAIFQSAHPYLGYGIGSKHMVVRGGFRWFVAGIVVMVACLLSLESRAAHIIGGDVSMRAVGNTPGLFTIQLNQYWDQTKSSVGNQDPVVTLLIYRKNNPVLIETLTLLLRETVPLTFSNAACAALRQLSFTQGKYYTTYQFDPKKYTDPGGYYMVWERCCRNDALTNVNSYVGDGVAMTFYLEFPAMMKNGQTFMNSAPDFRLPNGDYICINKPFTFDVGATDADGDQLRYSLVTPLNGYTTRTSPTLTDESPRSSYPTINWAPGYSLSNIIPGNPPLSINPNTGQLTVRASAEGLYLFSVQCEEFRNGVRIGVVRRDFQLPVVDCSKNTPPPAVVMANGKATSSIAWCASQPLILSVEKKDTWAYQWQKDGTNLRGSTSDTLQVRVPGVYTVVKSLANECANDTTSQAVRVDFVTAPEVKLSLPKAAPYCAGDTLTLQAAGQPNYQYHWRRNGQDLAGENQATLRIYQSGMYEVLARPTLAVCDGQDSLKVAMSPKPAAQIKPSSLTFCPQETVQLVARDSLGIGNRYRWRQNNTPLADTASQLVAGRGGTYSVTITAATGCSAVSPAVVLTQYSRPAIQFDSIPPVCLDSNAALSLTGQPAGGTYTGAGVQGSRFSPITAGVGRHQLTYTVSSQQGCQAKQSRWIEVWPPPKIKGTSAYYIARGNSVQLLTQTTDSISHYQWMPPASLSQADVASPVASPAETTLYSLTATNAVGCAATLLVLVEVTELLFIPSAFSPNADGLNDAWVIPNITLFPNCQISIYDRWGELIFFSQGYASPWDGTYRQEPVPSGIYTYQIRTGDSRMDATYRGQLMVVR